jgi:hypothetical protein
MMSNSGAGDGGSGDDHNGHRGTPKNNPASSRPAREIKTNASKQSEIPPPSNTFNDRQPGSMTHRQHLLQLNNRLECSSNQSGSDSGLGYTNSISSENSSLIANTTSLEQIDTHSNGSHRADDVNNNKHNKLDNNENGRETQIARNDSFNMETQNSAASNNDSAISCIENGKIDAAKASSSSSTTTTTTTTTSIPNKAASASGLVTNAHAIEKQHLRTNDKQPVKSVKVSGCIINKSSETNQDNNNLYSSLSISRTKDELDGQEPFFDINESGLANNARVINNLDDEAKVKHSTRLGTNQSANSTIRPEEDDHELAGTAQVLLEHATQGNCAHFSDSDQLPLKINPIVSAQHEIVPLIKSSLKKSVDRSALNRSKQNRSVSFNPTVIVFCEEIETSSPSEAFEPPLDYQDASPVEEQHGLPSTPKSASNRDSKSQNVYTSDEFDILGKIVGDDASSLTDDQLFGLLENGSLLKNFDLDEDDKAFAIHRLNSDQSYLCHDAISDSGSESSLIIEPYHKEVPRTLNKQPNLSTKSRESVSNCTDLSTGNQFSSKMEHDKLTDQRNNQQSKDSCVEPPIGSAPSMHQRSIPARVKVSTVDNIKRHHKSNTNQIVEVDSTIQTRNVCPKVIQSFKQSTAKSEPMLANSANLEPVTVSRPQIRETVADNMSAKRQSTRESKDDNVCSQTPAFKSNIVPNSFATSEDQISSRDTVLVDQKEQHHNLPTLQHTAAHVSNQKSTVLNAQVIQTSQACHICRAIESSLQQNECNTRTDRASSMANNISSAHSVKAATSMPLQQRAPHPAQFHLPGGVTVESQHQKILHPVLISQSSCISCRESVARQQQNCVVQPERHNMATNPHGHPQPRPIACQLVYVVDQCGNRMKALQVVNPAQINNLENQSLQQTVVNPNNCRFPTPQAGQNWVRMSNTAGQVIGVVRNAPVQVDINKTHPMSHNNGMQPPIRGPVPSVINQQQRMQVISHSTPRNHTVYYVRQPLGAQEFRQSLSSSVSNSAVRSFPDVHEIRRLDGIRAPPESPKLIHTATHTGAPREQFNEKSGMQQQSNIEDRSAKLRKDDSEDPSFGFSRRPAVKVVANAMRESQGQVSINAGNNFINNQRESHTLDRKNINRDQLSQRETKENIPSTSSMFNINKTLTNFIGDSTSQKHEDTSKSKGMKFIRWFSIKR